MDMNKRSTPSRPRGILMSLAKCHRGAVALEFALGFPIFLALVYGLFEFARIFWTQNTMKFAIEEAARSAVVNSTISETELTIIVMNRAAGLNDAEISVDVEFEDANGSRGFVTITGTYDYSPIVPIVLPLVSGNSIDFEALAFDIVTSTRMPIVQ
jgi:Flp pilus assembly protein TadG